MQILPPAATIALAGTQRAAVRAGDAHATTAQAAGDAQRAEHPGGRSEAAPHVEAGDGASDGEADGRQLLQQHPRQPRQDSHDGDASASPPASPSPEGTGGQVDFQA